MLHEGKVGSITRTVDMNGSVRNEYDYGTFGTRSHVKTAGTGSNQNFGYTGEMLDAESGLLYLRARYYDPSIGRFISADPYLGRMAEPVTQNRYIYVHNNPLLFVDPSGNFAFLGCVMGAVSAYNASSELGGGVLQNAGASLVGCGVGAVTGPLAGGITRAWRHHLELVLRLLDIVILVLGWVTQQEIL